MPSIQLLKTLVERAVDKHTEAAVPVVVEPDTPAAGEVAVPAAVEPDSPVVGAVGEVVPLLAGAEAVVAPAAEEVAVAPAAAVVVRCLQLPFRIDCKNWRQRPGCRILNKTSKKSPSI